MWNPPAPSDPARKESKLQQIAAHVTNAVWAGEKNPPFHSARPGIVGAGGERPMIYRIVQYVHDLTCMFTLRVRPLSPPPARPPFTVVTKKQ